MNELTSIQTLPGIARIHVCFLSLIVKLSNEPNVRQNDKTLRVISEAEKLSWHLVDATSFEQIINWHVMSCDPRVVLCINGDSAHQVDIAVNK